MSYPLTNSLPTAAEQDEQRGQERRHITVPVQKIVAESLFSALLFYSLLAQCLYSLTHGLPTAAEQAE